MSWRGRQAGGSQVSDAWTGGGAGYTAVGAVGTVGRSAGKESLVSHTLGGVIPTVGGTYILGSGSTSFYYSRACSMRTGCQRVTPFYVRFYTVVSAWVELVCSTTANAYVQQRLIVVSSIEVPRDRAVPGFSETSQCFRIDSKPQLLHS